MSKIKYKINGGWTELSAADLNAASDSIIVNDIGNPAGSVNVKTDTKLYIDTTTTTETESGTILKIQTTDIEWPLSVDKGGTGTSSISAFVNNIKGEIFNQIYPVGAIYISMNSANPGTSFGGTWTQIKGRFLVAADNNGASGYEALNITAGAIGGEAKHLLEADESGVPAHTHSTSTAGAHTHTITSKYLQNGASGTVRALPNSLNTTTTTTNNWNKTNSAGGHTHTINNNATKAAAQPHNNLPPYLAVYMWQRIA